MPRPMPHTPPISGPCPRLKPASRSEAGEFLPFALEHERLDLRHVHLRLRGEPGQDGFKAAGPAPQEPVDPGLPRVVSGEGELPITEAGSQLAQVTGGRPG